MTKQELVKQICNERRFQWMTHKTCADIIETFMDIAICHFQDGGEQITLRGFGTFKIRRRIAFTGRNPKTGDAVAIPERNSLIFRPSAEMLRRINS